MGATAEKIFFILLRREKKVVEVSKQKKNGLGASRSRALRDENGSGEEHERPRREDDSGPAVLSLEAKEERGGREKKERGRREEVEEGGEGRKNRWPSSSVDQPSSRRKRTSLGDTAGDTSGQKVGGELDGVGVGGPLLLGRGVGDGPVGFSRRLRCPFPK